MADKPILFKAPMVRANNDGLKTQTRRLLPFRLVGPDPRGVVDWFDLDKEAKGEFAWLGAHRIGDPLEKSGAYKLCNWHVGDRLWVRETLKKRGNDWRYDADGEPVQLRTDDPRVPDMISWAHQKQGSTCVSIHMPRWASRTTLTVTDVRVQRLHDISEADVLAEGVDRLNRQLVAYKAEFRGGEIVSSEETITRKPAYATLWDEINGAGAWALNPWVAAYTYTVERRNIDTRDAA